MMSSRPSPRAAPASWPPPSRRPLLGALLGAALCLCCDSKPDTGPPRRLVLGATSEPDTLCPLLTESGTAHEVIGLLWRDLVVYDPTWTATADLAARVPALGPDAHVDGDGLLVHWRIRDDARWQDGAPVVADDFILAWRVQKDDRQEIVVGRDDARRIESITADDDGRGFTVRWREQTPFFAEPRVHRALPSHVLARRLTTATGGLSPLKDDPIGRAPLSNGPFMLAEWAAGQSMRLVRNEHYRPRPLLDEIVIRFLPSTASALAALQAGDIDAVLPSGGPSAAEADALTARAPDRFAAVFADGQQWVHVDVNLDDARLADVRVRRALALALPREQLARALSPRYRVADTHLPDKHWGASAVPPIPFDRARARALLDEAGLRPGPDGVRARLTLSAASGSVEGERLAQLLQAAWRDVGLDVALDLRPFKVFFGEGVKRRRLPHLAMFAWTFDASAMGGAVFRADKIPTAENGWKGNNTTGYRNARVTQLFADADRTLPLAARRALLAEANTLLAAELPALPLYWKPTVALSSTRVRGLAPTGTMTPLAWNAHQWSVEQSAP